MLQTWYIISISIVILLHCIAWATLLLCLHSVWWGGWEKILTASNSIRSIITVLSTAETYQLIRVDTLLITFIYMFFKSKKKIEGGFPRFQSSTPWVMINTLGDIWGETIRRQVLLVIQPIWKIWVKWDSSPNTMKIKHIWNHHQSCNDRKSSAQATNSFMSSSRVGCKTQPQWAVMIFFVGTKKLQTQLAKDNLSQPLSWSLCDSFVSLLPNVHVTSLHYRYLTICSPLRFWVKSIKRMPSKRSACLFEQQQHQTYKSSVLKMDLPRIPNFLQAAPSVGPPISLTNKYDPGATNIWPYFLSEKEATIFKNYHYSQS